VNLLDERVFVELRGELEDFQSLSQTGLHDEVEGDFIRWASPTPVNGRGHSDPMCVCVIIR
jgi:hypothetical protein